MAFPTRSNLTKYGSVRQTYNGYSYQSKLEARYAAELDLRLRAHDIKSWEKQKTLRFYVNGVHVCDYRMDFVLTHNDGTIELVEVKGFETDVWKIKWKLLEALHDELYPGSRISIWRG